jgi:hypothetical protein
MAKYENIIHRVTDDSYVITKNGMPYHVCSNVKEFEEEWKDVAAYAKEHPECVTEEQPYVPPKQTLEEAKAAKLSEINRAADKAIAALTTTYPDREISTFDKQEAEARAYTADPEAPTPLLSALAKARGLSMDELVKRVLIKADAFAAASGSIIGQRQALEDRLDACRTLEEVQGIVVIIIMPEGVEA